MAKEDLIPLNKRTKDEQKKIQSSGGKKSGEIRRQKRLLKDCMIDLLNLPVKDTEKWNTLSEMGIDPKNIDNRSLMTVGLFIKAANGDVAAFKEIRSLVGEDKATGGNGEWENLIEGFNKL